MKERMLWADILRILAIYLVLVVHTTFFPTTLNVSTLPSIALFAIAKTCVPLFFMLSGALLLSRSEPQATFYKKRLTRFLYPFTFWTLIFIALLLVVTPPSQITEIVNSIKTGIKVFWFLPIIFCLYFLTPHIRTYTAHASVKQIWVVILFWFFIVSFIPYVRNTEAFPIQKANDIVTVTLYFSGYYILGFLLFKSNAIKGFINPLLVIIIGILWSILGVILSSHPAINLSYVEYISPSIIVLSAGIFLMIKNAEPFFQKRCSKKMSQSISTVSAAVLGVYLLHTIYLQIFERLGLPLFPRFASGIIYTLASSIILFIGTLSVVLVLKRIPKLRKFIS